MTEPIMRVTNVTKHFPISEGIFRQRQSGAVRAVDGISFEVMPGETLGLVGESGCGKSTAGRTILRLVEPTSGTVEFAGNDITKLAKRDLVPLRRDLQMIFQDPFSSLNPRHTIGDIIAAPFKVQKVKPTGGIQQAVQDLLERVGLNPEHYNRYPGDFSGGQRQRIGIARAIALQPKFIVCDEPVSALDVSIQAQVLNLLEDIQNDYGIAYLFVAHDLSVVHHISDRVAVMYLGKIMEIASRDDLFATSMHPYTHALMSAVPIADPDLERNRERIILKGELPSPSNPPSGCVFNTRCPKKTDLCVSSVPELRQISPGHEVACHYPEVISSATVHPAATGMDFIG